MALQIDKILENGTTATYHMIVDVIFRRSTNELLIEYAGFIDKEFRIANWKSGNTNNTSVYISGINISGDDFMENIYPYINDAGAVQFCYNLLKERVVDFKYAIDA